MPLETFTLADDPRTLSEGLARLADLTVVGVDVERADWDRYYRAAALIQVGGEGDVLLVDPLALDDLSMLQSFLTPRTAVFHALENDLGPLASLGVDLDRVEDTAIAAAMLGLPTGLETLLRELLGVELDADKAAMQRADWEKRPLQPAMLEYAAGDVADLPALHDELQRRLVEADRAPWYAQELEALLAMPSVEERRDWTRLKGVGRLDPQTRSRARALWDARERLARDTDTAPGRIAPDRVLLDLAVHPPSSTSELGRRGMRRQAVREFGDALVSVALEAEESVEPPSRARPVTDEDRAKAEALRTLRAARAEELGLDPGVLCPNRTLMGAVLADPDSPEELRDALGLRAWQWELLGNDFCEALELPSPGTAGMEDTSDDQEPADG